MRKILLLTLVNLASLFIKAQTGTVLPHQAPSVLMDGNGYLGPTYNNSSCGLNYVQGSVLIETRSKAYGFNTKGTGLPTFINISGLPNGYSIDKAFLWFGVSFTENKPPIASVIITNPS